MTSPFCCGASVGQLVAAGMTGHMGVRLCAQIGRDGRPLDPFAASISRSTSSMVRCSRVRTAAVGW